MESTLATCAPGRLVSIRHRKRLPRSSRRSKQIFLSSCCVKFPPTFISTISGAANHRLLAKSTDASAMRSSSTLRGMSVLLPSRTNLSSPSGSPHSPKHTNFTPLFSDFPFRERPTFCLCLSQTTRRRDILADGWLGWQYKTPGQWSLPVAGSKITHLAVLEGAIFG